MHNHRHSGESRNPEGSGNGFQSEAKFTPPASLWSIKGEGCAHHLKGGLKGV